MKKIKFDQSKMSVSSDDLNNISSVSSGDINERLDTGSTRKCLFGIIILGCLVLSILIALDVISLKEIINIPSNLLSNKENNPTINAQKQVNQESKPVTSNQENKPEPSKQENKPANSNQENKP